MEAVREPAIAWRSRLATRLRPHEYHFKNLHAMTNRDSFDSFLQEKR